MSLKAGGLDNISIILTKSCVIIMSSILDNRYRLIKLIGKGGMAADVYLAYDEV